MKTKGNIVDIILSSTTSILVGVDLGIIQDIIGIVIIAVTSSIIVPIVKLFLVKFVKWLLSNDLITEDEANELLDKGNKKIEDVEEELKNKE